MKLFKFILIGTIALITPTITFAVTPFNSSQLAPSPIDGYVLKTLSGINVWSPGGGGSGGGPWSTTTSQVSGRLINYPNNNTDIVSVGSSATSSSLTFFDPNILLSKFRGTVMVGDVTSPQLNAFGTGYYPFQIEKNEGDITAQTIWNTNSTSTLAGAGLFLNNGNTPHGGIGASGKYYAGFVLTGPSWNGVPVGFGAAQPNDLSIYNTDGSLILASATSTMGNTNAIKFFIGNGSFYGGIPDMLLNAVGNLGIGTSSPLARLTLHANNGDTNRLLLAVGSSTQSATTTLLALNNIGYLGIGTSTPSAVLDITPASAFVPSLAVNGGQGGIDIARFYRDASSGMGLAFLSPGSIPQISFRINMSSLSAGTSRNSLLVDSAGATFRIATSTTNAVNDLEPFVVKNSNSFVGIATSSPFAQFSIQPNIYNGSAPSFVIGSSTGTSVIVNGSGFVGIGTSTPKGQLSVSAGSSLYTSVAPLFVENNGSAGGSYVTQMSAGSSVGNSYPSFNLTNSGTTILNSQSPFMYYGTINAPGSGGGNQKGQLYINNGNSSTNWFNIFVDSSTNANLSANGPIRVFKTLGGTSDIFNVASSTGGLATSTYLTVGAYGNTGIGTSTPFATKMLTISNPSSKVELSLTNGSLTTPQWDFNVLQNGDLAIASSSPSTGATSTLTSLLLSATGNAGVAISSSSPFATLSVNPLAGAFSNQFAIGSSSATSLILTNSGLFGIGTSTPVAVINSYAVTASSTNLLLDAISKGGCFIMKDTNGTGYSQFTAQGGVLTGKVATSLTQCN